MHAVANSLWHDISWLYGSAVMSVTGTNAPMNTSSCPCPVLALMLYVHIVFALLVPLYILGLHESRAREAFMQQVQRAGSSGSSTSVLERSAGSGSSRRSNSSSLLATQPGHHQAWQQRQQVSIPTTDAAAATTSQAAAGALAGTGHSAGRSNSSSNGDRSNGGSATSSIRAGSLNLRDLDENAGPASSSQDTVYSVKLGLGTHALLLVCFSILIWGVLDAGVSLWSEQLASHIGVCA